MRGNRRIRRGKAILFLTPRDSKTNLGGVERHVRLLTEELERRGHEVKELSLDEVNKSYKDYKNYKNSDDNSIKDSPWLTPRRILFGFTYKFWAWKYLWDRRVLFRWAEVVHVHDVFWWVAPFLPIIRWNKGYKDYKNNNSIKDSPWHSPRRILFTTFHGWEGRYPPTRSAVWQKRLAAWLSGGTIGVGSFFEKWYGVKTDRVVWGGLGNKFISSLSSLVHNQKTRLPRSAKGGPRNDGPIKVVFFGRLEDVNGAEIVIKAINRLNKSYKDYKNYNDPIESSNRETPWHTPRSHPIFARRILFLFVGDGSFRKQAEKVGRVTGMVAEPWEYLVGAEVVIASSYLAILEAAALGKRIIAVANNPLKRDYLESHPLRDNIKIVETVEELVGEITDKSYKDYKNYKEGEGEKNEKDKKDGKEKGKTQKDQKGEGKAEEANAWALGQTAEKLADEYEKLWRIREEG